MYTTKAFLDRMIQFQNHSTVQTFIDLFGEDDGPSFFQDFEILGRDLLLFYATARGHVLSAICEFLVMDYWINPHTGRLVTEASTPFLPY